MIKALEGWKFDGPKGQMTIRAADHALLQPMFQAKLVKADVEVRRRAGPKRSRRRDVAPPRSRRCK